MFRNVGNTFYVLWTLENRVLGELLQILGLLPGSLRKDSMQFEATRLPISATSF